MFMLFHSQQVPNNWCSNLLPATLSHQQRTYTKLAHCRLVHVEMKQRPKIVCWNRILSTTTTKNVIFIKYLIKSMRVGPVCFSTTNTRLSMRASCHGMEHGIHSRLSSSWNSSDICVPCVMSFAYAVPHTHNAYFFYPSTHSITHQ